jgi:hypothetical protein
MPLILVYCAIRSFRIRNYPGMRGLICTGNRSGSFIIVRVIRVGADAVISIANGGNYVLPVAAGIVTGINVLALMGTIRASAILTPVVPTIRSARVDYDRRWSERWAYGYCVRVSTARSIGWPKRDVCSIRADTANPK